jgi:hypothetical protein
MRLRRISASAALALAVLLLESGCNHDRYTSVAAGVDGLGLISYRSGDGILKVGHCEDNACTRATLSIVGSPIDFQGRRVGVGAYSSIAIGRDGLGLISYQSAGLGVAHCEDIACTRATLSILDSPLDSDGTPVLAAQTSIAIGSDGLGLISYRGPGLKVAHCEDVACTRARVSTIDERRITYYANALAIGQDGRGLITYANDFNGSLLVAHCEDTACSEARLTSLGASGTIRNGGTTSIAVGSDGLGLIAHNNSDLGVLKIAHCQDTACTAASFSTIDDGPHAPNVGGYVGAYHDIAIGADGLGLVSYYEEPVGNLRVAHCADVPCTRADAISIIDNGGRYGRVGTYTSVAIGGDGLGLISFQGSLSSFLDQDVKVAHCQDVACRSATVTTLERAAP